ncbi:MAG: hypothetical protein KGQ41_00050 [Alphaproteobacteria bacterium]|nr:hypothetical protein [Alphaproteobacteria bacterium]
MNADKLQLQFGTPVKRAPITLREFKLDASGTGLEYRHEIDLTSEFAAIDGEAAEKRKALESERAKREWEQFINWLLAKSAPFEKFFAEPAKPENFGALGLKLDDGEDPADAFANYQLHMKVLGTDLAIEKNKISVTANSDETPVEAILTGLALAIKNNNIKDGVKITAGKDAGDMKTFAYLAFKKAGFKILNADEFEAEGAKLDDLGQEAWNALLANQNAKNAITATYPVLANLFADTPPAPLVAQDLPALPPVPEIDATSAAAALAAVLASQNGDQSLGAALKKLPAYDPTGIPSYEENNKLAPALTVEQLDALEVGKYEGEKLVDMRASAIHGLLRGKEAQENMIIGQILMRALEIAIKSTDSDEKFVAALVSKGVETARAEQLKVIRAHLHEAMKAMPKGDYLDRDKPLENFPDLTKLTPEIREALQVLIESQHNPVGGVKENFAGTSHIVDRILQDENFLKFAPAKINFGATGDVGAIAEQVFQYSRKTPHIQSKPEGGKEEAESKVDVPNELGQAWIATYRMVTLPNESLGLANMKAPLNHPPFTAKPDGTRQPWVLQETATAQYVSLLVRGMVGLDKMPAAVDFDETKQARDIVAYAVAKAGVDILSGYNLEGTDPLFAKGVDTMKWQLDALMQSTGNNMNSTRYTEHAYKALNADDPAVVAQTVGKAIATIEANYLKAANALVAKGELEQTVLDKNIEKLSAWRKNTAAVTAGNFAGIKPVVEAELDADAAPAMKPQ